MNKKEIESKYINKIKLLNEFNKFYYDKSNPKISDKEYDDLKKEILILEKNFNFLKSVTNSPFLYVSEAEIPSIFGSALYEIL